MTKEKWKTVKSEAGVLMETCGEWYRVTGCGVLKTTDKESAERQYRNTVAWNTRDRSKPVKKAKPADLSQYEGLFNKFGMTTKGEGK